MDIGEARQRDVTGGRQLRIYLGHGASGNAASMRPHVEGLRSRGLDAAALDLPKGNAERAVPRLLAAVGESHDGVVIGGHSYGGRVASLAAAGGGFAGLVLLSYPLHRPGHPEEVRASHWPDIRCPTLVLSGDADPFARVDRLREAVRSLPSAESFTYPRVGHGLIPVLDDALDRIGGFVTDLAHIPGPP